MRVYNALHSRARENNMKIDNDFLLIKQITNIYNYHVKKDKDTKQEYIDDAQTNDLLIRKSDICKIEATFPVKIQMKDDRVYECLQSFSMIYNQLFRDCSTRPYTPYGEYLGNKEEKETKSENLENNNIDEDFL